MEPTYCRFNYEALALVWRQQPHGRRLVVGHLRGERFAYDGPDLALARSLGFTAYPEPPAAETFAARLPRRGSPEYAQLLEMWAVDPAENEPIRVAAATAAYRSGDTFELIPHIEPEPDAYFRTDLAGFQFYVAAEDLRPIVGAQVGLEPDPKNRFDDDAVVVRYHGVLLGYVKRIHNQAVRAAVAAGLHVEAALQLVTPDPFGTGWRVLLGVRFRI